MRLARLAAVALAVMMFTSLQVCAQDMQSVRFQRYGVDDGLSQTTIRALHQDRQGFIWLGTQDGLNRFDGYEFRIYRSDPLKPDTLADNHIVALEQAADQNGFWVGTQTGGLALYNPINDNSKAFKPVVNTATFLIMGLAL